MHPNQAPKTDGFAITSMVLGIIAVLTCIYGIILGIIAVVFGHLAIGKIKRNSALGGKGMAIAGLVCGYVAIAASIIAGIMFAVAINQTGGSLKDFQKQVIEEREKQRIQQEQIMQENSAEE